MSNYVHEGTGSPLRGTWKMANFLRSATIVLMGATVMGAGVFVVIYS